MLKKIDDDPKNSVRAQKNAAETAAAGSGASVPEGHTAGPGKGLIRFVPSWMDLLWTVALLAAVTLIGLLFARLGFSEANIITVYILGVLITSILAESPAAGVISSLASVLLFNYFFIEPRFSFHTYETEYLVTFAIMLAASLTTGTLANRLKETARQSAESAFRTQVLSAKNQLLRSVSHDLRTPLTSISGNARTLVSHADQLDGETRRRIYADISGEAEWLIDVVENLLSVTRLENAPVSLPLKAELVSDVIEEALRHVSRHQDEHTLIVEPGGELLLARMDAKLIVQVLVNLINNAIAYTQTGSVIRIGAWREGDRVAVRVSDNGPGLPPDVREHLFEMYYTGKNRAGDSRRSLGLGLSLCRSIVEAHGGELTLEDGGPGCVATFTLPAEEVTIHE